MTSLLTAAFLILTPIIASNTSFATSDTKVSESVVSKQRDYLATSVSTTTESRFEEENMVIKEPIPFETVFKENPEAEIGTQEIIQEGINGTHTEIYKVIYWDGEEIERYLAETLVDPPQEEIILRGTKIIIREMDTELGRLSYWQKLTVFATSYDGNCPGCRGLTASGTPVKHGVCAVDPDVIPMGTNFYVPGYGICRSEDKGGAINGNRIDLGFEDISQGWWKARYVDIYLLE